MNTEETIEIDYLSSAEFDITEGIKDLVANIKLIKQDVDKIKHELKIVNKQNLKN